MRHTALVFVVTLTVLIAGCFGPGGGGHSFAEGGLGDGAAPRATGNVGLSAGGAQDAAAFRNNVRKGYVPQPTDITAEGVFHDYYFDTGQSARCKQLFCPSYSRAVSRDPLSNESEQYLTVGLNSGLSKADFERKKLNLVIVLDTSGSMESSFDEYYYDNGTKQRVEDQSSKMAAAREAVIELTSHLESDDRFGLVTYDSEAEEVQPLTRVSETDREALRNRIRKTSAGGSTNLDAGMEQAMDMLDPHRNANQSEYETRVIYVTDAMPNVGDTGGRSLEKRLQSAANDRIYSTFVGVGVDFNTELVETINSVRGANYYTVRSPEQFRERMDEGFDYMVTPLVFDLSLTVESEGYEIAHVYGSPTAEEATGELLNVPTLFPSRTTNNRTEGGVVLVKLRKAGEGGQVRLSSSYETRTGAEHNVTRTVTFDDRSAPYYESSGVRKAVVLARYTDLMRNWAAHERAPAEGSAATPGDGIEHQSELGRWEQQSVELQVSSPYDRRIARFESYFASERQALGADRMERDAKMLDTLVNASSTSAPDTATTAAGT